MLRMSGTPSNENVPAKGAACDAMLPAVEHHDAIADGWEENYRRPAFRARERLFSSCLEGLNLPAMRWLDAGCGSGRMTRMLAARGCAVDAVDASPAMIAAAQRETEHAPAACRPTFQRLPTIEKLPFPDQSYEGVLCSSVVEYLPQPRSAIAEFARVLKPGGRLLVSVPNRRSLFRRLLVTIYRLSKLLTKRPRPAYLEFSKNEYSRWELVRLLTDHQFIVEKTIFFGGRFPIWFQRLPIGGPLILAVASKRA
jgi:2-polyprenyl-3-methyl-5-hydroxy-6-metoxy-1,4-benzoquinol methylase